MAKLSLKDYLLPSVQCLEELHRKNFLLLEGREHRSGDYIYSYPDTYVAKTLSHHHNDWYDSHAALHQESVQMLTLRQFVDFLNLLKSKKAFDSRGQKVASSELEAILGEITKQRNPWRAEWLDAGFEDKKGQLYINCEHRAIDGKLTPQRSEPLFQHLAQNKLLGIDLDDYLKRATVQGLPPENVKSGGLYYWAPMRDNNSVARFRADADGVFLNGRSNPQFSYSALGVRRVLAKN